VAVPVPEIVLKKGLPTSPEGCTNIEMDGNDAPCTLYHKLNQEGTRGEGTPGAGKNPERDERGTARTGYDYRGPTTNKLTVVSAELPRYQHLW
jgi:hypothetical protein